MSYNKDTAALIDENTKLQAENERMKHALQNRNKPLSDDAVDGIVATIVIAAIVIGVVFWLTQLPS